MKRFTPYLIIILVFGLSCEKDLAPAYTFDKLSGLVQKGPYINGTAITVAELNENLNPTGKTFSTQIVDNKGSFVINEVALESPYVEIRADGFYFDEVKGEKSIAQLTLFGLADVSDQNSINVNILTQLEKGRVEYLVGEGLSFEEAKSQAQADVLNIFRIEYENMSNSEQLDISKEEDENAILLAISLMVQGDGSVGDLTELLANINTDIREDGILNSSILDSLLISQASSLNVSEIRKNLNERYDLLGVDATISNFDLYINNFLPGRLNLIKESSDISCNGLNDGEISVSVTGGTAPYTFLWSNGDTENSISNLGPGNYSVIVTDSRYYSSTIDAAVNEPQALKLDTSQIINSEYEMDNGAINILATGGTAPYSFLWSNSSSAQNIAGLSSGLYSVIITDANSCSSNSSFQVFEQSYLTTNVSCHGSIDGAIDLIVSSGTPPYTFKWSNGAISEDIVEVTAGIYSVTITDANQNSYEITDIVISEPNEIIISAETKQVNEDGAEGEIDITVSGGTPPYSYLWSNGEVTEDIFNLIIGTYTVEVRDANNCISTKTLGLKGNFTDKRDGGKYEIVTIGEQIWMAENLAYLPSINLSTEKSYSIPYYYVYDFEGNNREDAIATPNYQTYGVLYNWPAAITACPSGWHLPSDEEWKQMEMYIGMSQEEADVINNWRGTDEGDKLKSQEGWDFDDNANNESGFTALPGGGLWSFFGEYGQIGYAGAWWPSTEIEIEQAYSRIISSQASQIHRYEDFKQMGFSVRCVKD